MSNAQSSTDQSSETTTEAEREMSSVLIVEDEKELADLYAAYLEAEYDVRIAYDGDDALEALDDDLDVVLLDRRLGDWRGDELVTVIHDRQIDCQIAMVTAVNPDFDIIDLAIDDYIVKPTSKEELREKIDELLTWKKSPTQQQELLALVSRKIALEEQKSDAELDESVEYSKLARRIAVAKDRLEIDPSRFNTWTALPDNCPECTVRWDVRVGNTVGFLQIGAFIWKCTHCGAVVHRPDPSDRKIARR